MLVFTSVCNVMLMLVGLQSDQYPTISFDFILWVSFFGSHLPLLCVTYKICCVSLLQVAKETNAVLKAPSL